jgi:glycerate-2-kinase
LTDVAGTVVDGSCGGGEYAMSQLHVALIAGGESTVTVGHGPGKGDRNQDLATVVAQHLQARKLRDVVFASVGTDRTDTPPTDAAWTVVDLF